MRAFILISGFVLVSLSQTAQTDKFYTLTNDSLSIDHSKKTVLIFFTDHSCFDCFVSINEQLRNDTNIVYYFIIEKNNSAMSNYNIYSRLTNNNIAKNQVLFTKEQTHQISPFVKIYNNGDLKELPYVEIFENKETLQLSKKMSLLIKQN